jgi:hypothetical protein
MPLIPYYRPVTRLSAENRWRNVEEDPHHPTSVPGMAGGVPVNPEPQGSPRRDVVNTVKLFAP